MSVPPRIAPFDFGSEPANMEETVSVTCILSSGDQPIDIEWLFNDYGLSSYSGVTVLKGSKRTSVLTIENVQARHAGLYTCRARNLADSVNYTANLIVNGTLLFKQRFSKQVIEIYFCSLKYLVLTIKSYWK